MRVASVVATPGQMGKLLDVGVRETVDGGMLVEPVAVVGVVGAVVAGRAVALPDVVLLEVVLLGEVRGAPGEVVLVGLRPAVEEDAVVWDAVLREAGVSEAMALDDAPAGPTTGEPLSLDVHPPTTRAPTASSTITAERGIQVMPPR